MVRKMVAWGDDWSEKQVGFARILMDRIIHEVDIQLQREAEREAAAPVPVTDKRIRIEGVVLSIKVAETQFGYVTKALIKTDDGWKAYGTAPLPDLKSGQRVAFMARLEPSKDDPKFGYYVRPTKAEVLP
jgi:hypothetical protein